MRKVREIQFYKTYFLGFYASQDETTQEKIDYVFDIIRYEKHVPRKFFKLLTNTEGIYEVRIRAVNGSIRVLSFFDDGNLVVLTNGFYKKTRKTPAREIRRAKKIKQEYFIEKHSM